MRVVHVINDLDRGGAETVLYRLLEGSGGRMDPVVVSLTSEGVIGKEIAELGIPVEYLRVSSSPGYGPGIVRLRSRLRKMRPDVVQTWMYHADLVGGIAAKTAGVRSIVWGLHATLRPRDRSAPLYRAGLAVAARLSGTVPQKIVCCSQQAASDHERIGYDSAKLVVIPNGFEGQERDLSRRSALRSRLGLTDDAVIVGSVGRSHPDKDVLTLLEAARLLRNHRSGLHLVLVGTGLDPDNKELVATVEELELEEHVSMMGPTDNVLDVYSALDVLVCSSVVEALPLALGEAMAVGIPVVTTDVGDAALMLKDPDRVVPVRSPEALAQALERLLELSRTERAELGERDRQTILGTYGMKQMVEGYLDLYEALVR